MAQTKPFTPQNRKRQKNGYEPKQGREQTGLLQNGGHRARWGSLITTTMTGSAEQLIMGQPLTT